MTQFKDYLKERVNDIVLLMLVVILWKSLEIGWDDPQHFVAQVFAVTFFGFVIGEILRYLWRHSHFHKK